MKIGFLFLVLMLFLAMGSAKGSYWFQVTNVTPIILEPNRETNFTVSVKGLGSEGAYVELVFKNVSQGLSIACPKMIKYVLPTGITKYNCTLSAGNIASGNYSFVVDVAAAGAPSGKKIVYVLVMRGQETNISKNISTPSSNQMGRNASKSTSGFGLLAAILAFVLTAGKRWD